MFEDPVQNQRKRRLKRLIIISLGLLLLVAGWHAVWRTAWGRELRSNRAAAKAEKLVSTGARAAAAIAAADALKLDSGNIKAVRVLLACSDLRDVRQVLFLRSRIAELAPADAENLQQLCILAIATRRIPLAANALAGLAKLKGETTDVLELQVRLLLAAGQMDVAEQQARLLVNREKDNPVGKLVVALGHIQNDRREHFESAEVELTELLQNEAVKLEALRGLREVALRRGDSAVALRLAQSVIEMPSAAFSDRVVLADITLRSSPERLEELVVALTTSAAGELASSELVIAWLRARGHREAAMQLIDSDPAFSGQSLDALVSRGKMLLLLEAWPELIKELSAGDWQQIDFLRKAILARALTATNEELRARQQWREAVTLALKDSESGLTLVEFSRGWPGWQSFTEDLLWEISQQHPRYANWALKELYSVYRRDGATKSLLRVSNAMADLNSEDFRLRNNIIYFGLLTGGDVPKLEADIAELYLKYLGNPVIASTYAVALVISGRPEEAVRILELLPSVELQRSEISVAYALALSGIGRTNEAKAAAERALKNELLPEERALLAPLSMPPGE